MEPYVPLPIPSSASPEVRAFLENELARIAYFLNNLETGGAGGASELSDLSDVNTSTPTNRNVLVADGVDFESRALVEADISDLGSYTDASADENISGQWDFQNAGGVRIFNSGGTDYLTASHDGTDFNFDFTNTARCNFGGAHLEMEGGKGVYMQGGGPFFLYDSTNVKYCRIVVQSAAVNYLVSGVAALSFSGISGFIRTTFDCDLRVRNGNSLEIFDSTNTDKLDASHDGVDFNFTFTNTTDVNFTNASAYKIDGNDIATSGGTTGGTGSAGAGNQYVELDIGGTIYKVLHDGTV